MTKTHRVPFLNTSLYSLALTTGYVGVLYLRKATRPSKQVRRDDQSVIIERLKSISIFTLLATFVFIPFVLVYENAYDNYFHAAATLRIFWGWSTQSSDFLDRTEVVFSLIFDCLKSLMLVSILFAGPLVDFFYFERLETALRIAQTPTFLQIWAMVKDDFKAQAMSLFGVRNFLVGPITEEFVFRSGILALHLASNISSKYMIFVTPLYFGVAHLHHAYEMVLEEKYAKQVIFFMCSFQLLYTTVYGWFAGFLFLRMGSIWPPIVVHMFCNFLGTPSFGEIGTSKKHTWVYRILLVLGIFGFVFFMPILIKSENGIL